MSLPDIRMQYTDTSSVTTERGVSRTDTTVSADSTTSSTRNSTSVEISETKSQSVKRLVVFASPVNKFSRTHTETTTETETFGRSTTHSAVATTDTCTMGECSMSPLPIGVSTDWLAVDAGADFTVALRAQYRLWDWGSNRWGQLGHPTADKCGSVAVPRDCSHAMQFLDP